MIPIIIDTDAGTDDLMAIAYLLAHPGVQIEAITVVHGLAHVPAGSRNIQRLLHLANRDGIQVFEGEVGPLRGSREFPAQWRTITDSLPGVRLPDPPAVSPGLSAVAFLKQRFKSQAQPVRVLALGPLTNLALALNDPVETSSLLDIVIMGGAVTVTGNLMDGYPQGANEVAEWNIYCDPEATGLVFDTAIPILLIPLDATNDVPLNRAYVEKFTSLTLTPLGQVVADVLSLALPFIDTGVFYAWDPLAAVALVDSSVVQARGARLRVVTDGKDIGQTKLVNWDESSLLRVAVHADAGRFMELFERPFHS